MVDFELRGRNMDVPGVGIPPAATENLAAVFGKFDRTGGSLNEVLVPRVLTVSVLVAPPSERAPVYSTGLPCSPNWFSLFPPENSLFRGVGNSKLKPHDISGLGGFDPAYSRPNPRNSLFFPCKTGKSGQRRVRSRLRPPPPTYLVDITALFSIL